MIACGSSPAASLLQKDLCRLDRFLSDGNLRGINHLQKHSEPNPEPSATTIAIPEPPPEPPRATLSQLKISLKPEEAPRGQLEIQAGKAKQRALTNEKRGEWEQASHRLSCCLNCLSARHRSLRGSFSLFPVSLQATGS